MPSVRRIRGVLLRLAKRRGAAIAAGLVLAVPAGWIEWSGRVDVWWADGLALVLGATGLAFLWIGVTGATPDWIDEEH
jgi:hypothetical protein